MQLDISWLVYTVDVTETSGDGEIRADLGQGAVDVPDILWLGVQGIVVHTLVVDTVFLTTSDTNFLPAVSRLDFLLS